MLGLSDITIEDLEHKKYGPNIIKTYRKLSTEKSQTDGYYILLLNYMRSSLRDFERYLRLLSSLDENDIQLILKQYNSNFTTYKIPPAAHIFKDLSEVLSRGLKNEFEIRGRKRANHNYDSHDSFVIASDNVTFITKLDLRPDIKVLRFDKKIVF